MAVTEVTSTSWFGRIGDSIKGILFGIVLIIVSLILMVWNERNAVRDIQANNEIGREVITVPNAEVSPGNEGKLVHLNGPAMTDDVVGNMDFGIEETAVRLSWESEIYQWVEEKDTETKKKLGGGEETVTTYSYRKEWVDGPVNSSGFKEKGHDNTGKQKFPSGSSQAENVTLGAFMLPSGLISQMDWSERYTLSELPDDFATTGSIEDGVFYTGVPSQPKVGDERVTFRITRPDDVSVMAVQKGDSFDKYTAKNGKTKFLLYPGLLTAEQVVEGEEAKAKMLRWILRGVGVFAMFIGFTMLLKPLSVLADVIPFVGSLVGAAGAAVSLLLSLGISFVVIAISWIAFRPMIGIPLLVVGVGCFVLIVRKLAKGREAAGTPPPPPGMA
ncbi:DUF1625 domain-containing protein [Haloferula helveola]|uniref:DUF1625 domain-containing protein n=1 Tax=Haloferula helveola TaxID=490095 RepID=A0ABN6H6Z5_9BACT|nr:DUF1625 domain-containing protein [Haloferula helveola]